MRLDWLPQVLQAAGLRVYTASGWERRGANGPVYWFNPRGVLWHHTATSPRLSTVGLLKLLIDGRADLPGPLANLGLERDGAFYVLASGRANHAGAGSWLGMTSNYHIVGIEPANDGRGEPWPHVQLDAYRRGTRAIIDKLGISEAMVPGHKEWAPTRKIDPYGLAMNVQRMIIGGLGDTMIIRPGVRGNYVKPYQLALNTWAIKQGVPNWTPVTVDGDYGPNTTAAVTRYQAAAEIGGIVPQLGALDDLTRDLLERFVEA